MFHRRYLLLILLLSAVIGVVLGAMMWTPDPPDRQFQQAMAAIQQRDFETVAETVQLLHGQPGFENHVDLLQGAYLLRSGNPAAALKRLSARRPEGELRAPVLLLVAESFYQLGHLTEAEMIARQLEQEQPDNVDAHRWLAAIYYDLGALNSAIDELGIVTTLDPQDYKPRHLLGAIYFDSDQFAESAKHYRKALALKPPSRQCREIIRNLAEALVKTRSYQEVLGLLAEASLDAPLLALKSQCQWSLGQQTRARETLERAEELDPDERLVLMLKARIATETGDPREAIAPLNRHLEHDPQDFECRYLLALSYRTLGEFDRYETEMARMEESKQLRRQLSDLGKQAIDRPRDAKIRDRVAEVCDKLGKHRLAEIYRRAANACRRAAHFAEPGR